MASSQASSKHHMRLCRRPCANSQGEVRGFDPTLDTASRSAHAIAEAAKAWGQNDDITVLKEAYA